MFLERLVQLLYPLELHSNNITDDSRETELGMRKEKNTDGELNLEASTSWPKQTAAAIASIKLNDMTEDTDIQKWTHLIHILSNGRSAISETCRLSFSTYDLVKNVGWTCVQKLVKLVYIWGFIFTSNFGPSLLGIRVITYLYLLPYMSRMV